MTRSKYSMFPIQYPSLWGYYKTQSQSFWVPEEIDLSLDIADFERLNTDEQYFIKMILAFFNQSDGIVNENLALRFYQDVDIPEARAFYAMQLAVEAIHSETYSLLIDTYVKNQKEKQQLFNATDTIPTIGKKAEWALRWLASDSPFSDRLFAFSVVEGLFFSGAFCSIFWIKSRGRMPGLCKANEWISRDEGLHFTFATELYRQLKLRSSAARSIIEEAVEIETEFVRDSLPVDLIGVNSKSMAIYVRYTADRLLQTYGMPTIYRENNPFSFMNLIDLQNKTNFFESRVSEYKRGHDTELNFSADF